jgi:hypothetical protein
MLGIDVGYSGEDAPDRVSAYRHLVNWPAFSGAEKARQNTSGTRMPINIGVEGRSQMESAFPRHRSINSRDSVQIPTLAFKIGQPFG